MAREQGASSVLAKVEALARIGQMVIDMVKEETASGPLRAKKRKVGKGKGKGKKVPRKVKVAKPATKKEAKGSKAPTKTPAKSDESEARFKIGRSKEASKRASDGAEEEEG